MRKNEHIRPVDDINDQKVGQLCNRDSFGSVDLSHNLLRVEGARWEHPPTCEYLFLYSATFTTECPVWNWLSPQGRRQDFIWGEVDRRL